jgi:hypothetical protein
MDVEMTEKDEKDDKDARVSNILKNDFVLIFIGFLLLLIIDGNEARFENYACQIRPGL